MLLNLFWYPGYQYILFCYGIPMSAFIMNSWIEPSLSQLYPFLFLTAPFHSGLYYSIFSSEIFVFITFFRCILRSVLNL
jgi:hypothetical protein